MNSLQHVSGYTAIACKYCELTALTLHPEFTFRNGATASNKCYTNFTLFFENIGQVIIALNLPRID